MSGITGVEFGPASCVLVCARRRGDVIDVSAAHVFERAVWPTDPGRAAELLTQVRHEKRFPRAARVVAWALSEGAAAAQAAPRALLGPLTAAGFRIEAVVTPQEALATLAALRPRAGPVASAWLAVNRKGAAIAIMREQELLFGRVIGWDWDSAAIGSQPQLLQRYSIVAHLAPEVRQGIESVRRKYGALVDSVVTCGDLPDLRSLTMPLIEELDLEVETLDSAEGLSLPAAFRAQGAETLSALRLACAASIVPSKGIAVAERMRAPGTIALAVVGAAALGVGSIGYLWWSRVQPVPAPSAADGPAATPVSSRRSTARAQPSSAPAAATRSVRIPPPGNASVPGRSRDSSAKTRQPPSSAVPPPSDSRRAPASTRAALPPPSGSTARGVQPPRTDQSVSASKSDQRPVSPPRARPESPSASSPRPRLTPAPAERSPARAQGPAPLTEPLPVIETILVSSQRRIAVIDGGAIVGVGDAVGSRTVSRIEVDSVYLKEPSGLEIRVPIKVRRAP